MSIRLKIVLLLVLLLGVSVGNTIFTFVLEGYGEEKLGWVIHTHEVLNESKALLSSMTDAETGQRGYLLTGNPTYLEPYLHGLIASETSFTALSHLTADNPIQRERLEMIENSMQKKLGELRLTVDLQKQGDTESSKKALAIVMKNSGKKHMDDMRLAILAFEHEEQLLLEERKGDFRESRAQLTTIVGIEVIFMIFTGIITIFFIKNKLFDPIAMLLANTSKMEKGEKQNIEDLLPKDEMGYLLSRFYTMSEHIYKNTEVLAYEASHDSLTDLNNRHGIHKKIRDAFVDLSGNDSKMAVVFIDLNNFKHINDVFGHDAGDAILRETAHRLQEGLRSDDVVFRVGGDEFVIVITNITQTSYVKTIVTKVLEMFTSPFIFQGNLLDISLSIGIAISPDDSTNSDEILKYADIAMYVAKHDKDTNYRFFDKAMLKREGD